MSTRASHCSHLRSWYGNSFWYLSIPEIVASPSSQYYDLYSVCSLHCIPKTCRALYNAPCVSLLRFSCSVTRFVCWEWRWKRYRSLATEAYWLQYNWMVRHARLWLLSSRPSENYLYSLWPFNWKLVRWLIVLEEYAITVECGLIVRWGWGAGMPSWSRCGSLRTYMQDEWQNCLWRSESYDISYSNDSFCRPLPYVFPAWCFLHLHRRQKRKSVAQMSVPVSREHVR